MGLAGGGFAEGFVAGDDAVGGAVGGATFGVLICAGPDGLPVFGNGDGDGDGGQMDGEGLATGAVAADAWGSDLSALGEDAATPLGAPGAWAEAEGAGASRWVAR